MDFKELVSYTRIVIKRLLHTWDDKFSSSNKSTKSSIITPTQTSINGILQISEKVVEANITVKENDDDEVNTAVQQATSSFHGTTSNNYFT